MGIANTIITISLILIVSFIFLAVFLSKKATRMRRQDLMKAKGEIKEDKMELLRKRWQGVQQHLYSPSESDWKLAIIESDKIVENLLEQKGFKGETMAEKLTRISRGQLRGLDLLWAAHKTRNRIAHEPGFGINHSETQRIVSYYEEILKELKSL